VILAPIVEPYDERSAAAHSGFRDVSDGLRNNLVGRWHFPRASQAMRSRLPLMVTLTCGMACLTITISAAALTDILTAP
jgi:hypothetical protein